MSRKYFDGGDTSYTHTLSEYSVNLHYDAIPADVLKRVKLMTLHTLGVSMAAGSIDLTKSAVQTGLLINGGTGGKATSWVGAHKLSAASAAFVNGTLADMLDWEDCSWCGHPSAGTFPAALALAEELGVSGKTYLEAVVAGLEVYLRVAMSVQPPAGFNHNKGWGLTSWQIFAAAAAASKIMGLDAARTNQAFGMACLYTTIPTNLMQATMSNAYHYQHGFPAMGGVMAAYAARQGIDNLSDGLDIPYAYAEQLTTEPHREWMDRSLNEFLLMKILIKHWPANMWVQTPVEIVHDLAIEHKIDPKGIAEIIIDPPTQFRMHCYAEGYSSLMEAQFSMPYVIAAMLLDPKPGAAWYTRGKMTDPTLLALAAKVKSGQGKEHTLNDSFNMYIDGRFPEKTVTIRMKDGVTYSRTQAAHKGHPDNMLTESEFRELFMHNAEPVLGTSGAEKLSDAIMNIENQNDLSSFGIYLVSAGY